MRSHSYLNTAKNILDLYDGKIPFSNWLKNFFREHKKFGSKDRKYIASLCYCHFRLGHAFQNTDNPERLLIGLFLTVNNPHIILKELKEEWNNRVGNSLDEKLSYLNCSNETY